MVIRIPAMINDCHFHGEKGISSRVCIFPAGSMGNARRFAHGTLISGNLKNGGNCPGKTLREFLQ
jgi:hypothetical protein